MNIQIVICSIIIAGTLIPVGYAVYQSLVYAKRKMRAAELRLHIDGFFARDGCDRADELLEECFHLIKHYRIDLLKLNHRRIFNVQELKLAAIVSMRKYCWGMRCRFNKIYAEFCRLRNKDAGARTQLERSQYHDLREVVIKVSAELNRHYFKLNALKAQY